MQYCAFAENHSLTVVALIGAPTVREGLRKGTKPPGQRPSSGGDHWPGSHDADHRPDLESSRLFEYFGDGHRERTTGGLGPSVAVAGPPSEPPGMIILVVSADATRTYAIGVEGWRSATLPRGCHSGAQYGGTNVHFGL